MVRDLLKAPWTAEQKRALYRRQYDKQAYAKLEDYYRVMAAETRFGRVISIKGEVLDEGEDMAKVGKVG